MDPEGSGDDDWDIVQVAHEDATDAAYGQRRKRRRRIRSSPGSTLNSSSGDGSRWRPPAAAQEVAVAQEVARPVARVALQRAAAIEAAREEARVVVEQAAARAAAQAATREEARVAARTAMREEARVSAQAVMREEAQAAARAAARAAAQAAAQDQVLWGEYRESDYADPAPETTEASRGDAEKRVVTQHTDWLRARCTSDELTSLTQAQLDEFRGALVQAISTIDRFETAQAVASVAACTVCKYNRVDRALRCGHVFCHVCVARVQVCPLCKLVIDVTGVSRIFL